MEAQAEETDEDDTLEGTLDQLMDNLAERSGLTAVELLAN